MRSSRPAGHLMEGLLDTLKLCNRPELYWMPSVTGETAKGESQQFAVPYGLVPNIAA